MGQGVLRLLQILFGCFIYAFLPVSSRILLLHNLFCRKRVGLHLLVIALFLWTLITLLVIHRNGILGPHLCLFANSSKPRDQDLRIDITKHRNPLLLRVDFRLQHA
ncbi:hypothetical protein MLD38_026835 [Melastoma candidum]|uniref:Uncharacterized protein n=1 Tax=Melastoma candidum TaxID=119954 RepID=A0ACB9P310_9MYRT|nr:hypothetical protein MLD38_026835 [Melastoma candidum]